MNKEFRIGDLFDIHPTKTYKLNNYELFATHGVTPVLSNSSSNNGISGYCGLEPTEEGNIITFSDTTTGADTMFYQSKPFIGYSHVQGMYPHNYEVWNEKRYLYVISSIRKASGTGWSYAIKFNRALVRELMIDLPVIKHSDPNHKYTIDDIDWQYMEERIKELEKDRIKKLESYLKATNLDEYELTDEDKKVLSLSRKSTLNENGSLETNCENVMYKEFLYSDLFKLLSQAFKVSKSEFNECGKTPAYSSDTRNNGCLGYVDREPLYYVMEDCPTYLVFGDHTKTMNIVHRSFCVMDNVKVLLPIIKMSDQVLLFITTVWKKSIPDLGYARHWSVAKIAKISLPVIKHSDPNHKYTIDDIDLQYMERYIRAIEKLVIKDVVLWADKE